MNKHRIQISLRRRARADAGGAIHNRIHRAQIERILKRVQGRQGEG